MTTPTTMYNPQATFPSPLGLEQYLGLQSPYGGQSQFPGTQYGGQSQFPGTQYGSPQVQQVLAQILPIAYQIVLPQVVAVATQHIQHQLHQLVQQQIGQQYGSQFGQQSGWQQFGPGQQRPWGF
jgi:hypothetical protein